MVAEDIGRPTFGPEPADFAIEGRPIESTHEYCSKDGTTSGVSVCSPGCLLEEDHAENEFCTEEPRSASDAWGARLKNEHRSFGNLSIADSLVHGIRCRVGEVGVEEAERVPAFEQPS